MISFKDISRATLMLSRPLRGERTKDVSHFEVGYMLWASHRLAPTKILICDVFSFPVLSPWRGHDPVGVRCPSCQSDLIGHFGFGLIFFTFVLA